MILDFGGLDTKNLRYLNSQSEQDLNDALVKLCNKDVFRDILTLSESLDIINPESIVAACVRFTTCSIWKELISRALFKREENPENFAKND